jgi:hypothetical protein
MNGPRQTLPDHVRIDVFDGLAQPGELQPEPLLVVVATDLFSRFVVVLLQVLFELLEDEGLLVFLDVELELALFLLKGLFLVVTVLRLER